MPFELLKNKTFRSKIKAFYKENAKELLDIVLFGSTTKGKEKPRDIDILLLFKEHESTDLAYALRKQLSSWNVSITTKTYKSLTSPSFLAKESFLAEGYSLISDSWIAQGFGYKNVAIFKYKLIGFSQSKRMRFQYSLYGRKKQGGMINELSLIKFSDTILISPTNNVEKTKDYLSFWKIQFEEIPILVPQRLL